MEKPILPDETETVLHFPKCGLDTSAAYSKQPNRPMPVDGDYARTTPLGINVRAFDRSFDRNRGGSRIGLSKYILQKVPIPNGRYGIAVGDKPPNS